MSVSAKTTTVKDLAQELGLGTMTVSRALSGHGSVAPQTRKRVLEAARKLRYEPNLQARGLASGRGQGIALFSMLLLPGGSARIIEKLQHGLNQHGYDAPLHGFGAHDWRFPARQVELVRALVRSRPRAVICNNSLLSPAALDEFGNYIESGGIVVCFGHESNLPCDQILPTYADMVASATRYLLELGHCKIGYYDPSVNNPLDPASTGFLRALAEAGIEPNHEWLWDGPAYEEGGVWLAERFLAMDDRPTAIVSTMDATANVFIYKIERSGLRVPLDVSIVGMNDMPASQFWQPTLTAMHQPFDELAQMVVQRLEQRLAGDDGAPEKIRITGHLVPRETTAPPRQG